MKVRVRCHAKLNLLLEIAGKRADGFHDIVTIFQPVGLWDDIAVTRTEQGIFLDGDAPDVPWNEENLCYRSAELLLGRYGIPSGVKIVVEKRIPSGAGLGGASADAAGTLMAINRLFELGLNEDVLRDLALEIGSDVPFFIYGKTCIS